MSESKILNSFKQSSNGVKLATAVAAGVAVGVVGTLALQAYGRRREEKALQDFQPTALPEQSPEIRVIRLMPAVQ